MLLNEKGRTSGSECAQPLFASSRMFSAGPIASESSFSILKHYPNPHPAIVRILIFPCDYLV